MFHGSPLRFIVAMDYTIDLLSGWREPPSQHEMVHGTYWLGPHALLSESWIESGPSLLLARDAFPLFAHFSVARWRPGLYTSQQRSCISIACCQTRKEMREILDSLFKNLDSYSKDANLHAGNAHRLVRRQGEGEGNRRSNLSLYYRT